MDRNTFEMYWNYYLSIEKMMRSTSQYVCPSKLNKNTYSDEFIKIILLSCSEIDAILKVLCKESKAIMEDRLYNMSVYAKVLSKLTDIKDTAYSTSCLTSSVNDGIICFPFKELDQNKPYAGLTWWRDYQKLKHNRIYNVKLGNLENAVYSITAHYILLRILMDTLTESLGKEYVKENYWSNYLVICA